MLVIYGFIKPQSTLFKQQNTVLVRRRTRQTIITDYVIFKNCIIVFDLILPLVIVSVFMTQYTFYIDVINFILEKLIEVSKLNIINIFKK